MTATVDALLKALTSFAPKRESASPELWRELVLLAPRHGVAPLVAYNVEYRLAGSGAPQEARDVLLSHYQGALADNVFKLVNLKQALRAIERPVLLLDAAAVADTLFPHVAFRPMNELRVMVRAAELPPILQALAGLNLAPEPAPDPLGAAVVVTDGRTRLAIHIRLFPEARAAEEGRLWDRAVPAKAYGSHVLRPSAEDALLCQVLLRARAGFDVPLVELIDLRELARGSPDLGGPYSRALDAAVVKQCAKELKIERALWAAMGVVIELFPEQAERARALQPELRSARAALMRRWVIAPACDLHRERAFFGEERLKRLLAGG